MTSSREHPCDCQDRQIGSKFGQIILQCAAAFSCFRLRVLGRFVLAHCVTLSWITEPQMDSCKLQVWMSSDALRIHWRSDHSDHRRGRVVPCGDMWTEVLGAFHMWSPDTGVNTRSEQGWAEPLFQFLEVLRFSYFHNSKCLWLACEHALSMLSCVSDAGGQLCLYLLRTI